jgi:hypothetical protein
VNTHRRVTVGDIRAMIDGLGDDAPALLAVTQSDQCGELFFVELAGLSREESTPSLIIEIEATQPCEYCGGDPCSCSEDDDED